MNILTAGDFYTGSSLDNFLISVRLNVPRHVTAHTPVAGLGYLRGGAIQALTVIGRRTEDLLVEKDGG